MKGTEALALLHREVWTEQAKAEVVVGNDHNSTVKVAGFTLVESKKAVEQKALEARTQRKEAFLEARAEADRLKTQFEQNGITPIAVLPTKVWERLCEEAQLYRFESLDENNTVWCCEPFTEIFVTAISFVIQAMSICFFLALSGSLEPRAVIAGVITHGAFLATLHLVDRYQPELKKGPYNWALMLGLGLPGLVAVAVHFKLQFGTWWAPSSLLAGGLCSSFLAVVMGLGMMMSDIKKTCALLLAPMLRLIPEKKLHRTLWPKRIDQPLTEEEKGNVARVEVSFPAPPQDVAETLHKTRELGLETCVAAVDEAILVNRDSLLAAIETNIVNDPIVYTKQGGLIAVLAQFGSFPVEEDVIRQISGVEFLN